MKGIKLENFSNYWIFPDLGMVWSIPRKGRNKHQIKGGWIGYINPRFGYVYVDLMADDGTRWKTSLQRLIWTAVNGEIPENMVINHLDETPSNNAIWNLSACTQKENINYGTRTTRAAEKHCKLVEKCTLDGTVINIYNSLTDAAKCNNLNINYISACCHNKYAKQGNVYKGNIYKFAS